MPMPSSLAHNLQWLIQPLIEAHLGMTFEKEVKSIEDQLIGTVDQAFSQAISRTDEAIESFVSELSPQEQQLCRSRLTEIREKVMEQLSLQELANQKIKHNTSTKLSESMIKQHFADGEIVLSGGLTLWAHKIILTTSCEYFRLMFASGAFCFSLSPPFGFVPPRPTVMT